MKLAHVLEKVFHEPWLITPGGYSSVVALVESKLSGQLAQKDEEETVMGLPIPRVEASIDSDGIATVPIAGILGYRVSNLEKVCGATDYLEIQRATETGLTKGAKGILYAFDSSGGMVRGCSELATYIRGLPVPTGAFTDGKCSSAAYWLASATGSITATESADVGSIGVILPWIDRSRLWEAGGIKWDAIHNAGADLKGTGAGPSLTPAQRTYLQESVDHIGAKFRAAVTSRRPQVSTEVFRAGSYFGDQALKVGLVDRVGLHGDARAALLAKISPAPATNTVSAKRLPGGRASEAMNLRAASEASSKRSYELLLAQKVAGDMQRIRAHR